MNDIIATVQYMKNIVDWSNVVGFIASVLTIIGTTLPRILVKPKKWKDRKAIRYSILNPINISENNGIMEIIFFIEILKMIIPIIVLLMTVYFCLFWINYNGFKDNIKGYLLILTEINTCILCNFIKTKKQSKAYRIPSEIAYVILLDFSILEYVVEYGILHGVAKMLVFMTIICVFSFIIIEGIFFANKNDIENRSKWSLPIRIVRVIWGSVYMIVLFYFTTNDAFEICGKKVSLLFVIVYMALCYIESKINSNIKVEFKIDMGQDVEVTQKAIYQYEYDKVKYTLANGCTKIIDSDEIQSINYTTKNSIWDTIKNFIGKTKKLKVTCLLEDNNVLKFDGYKFINDLWVSFYKLNKNEREIKIINSKKVKKIVIE